MRIWETKYFTTASNNQEIVAIEAYEDEWSIITDNHFLDNFDLMEFLM
jgi:molecular chaperone DnaK (HSP70)